MFKTFVACFQPSTDTYTHALLIGYSLLTLTFADFADFADLTRTEFGRAEDGSFGNDP